MKKTILVTGLHGFIGSRFAELADRNFSLIDINRSGKKTVSGIVCKVIKCDLLDKNQIRRILNSEKIDIVLHLAAKAHIDKCEKDKKLGKDGEAWIVNVQATQNIIEGCRGKNIKIFYLSTECVFDGKRGRYKETDKTNPINWYGQTKKTAEELIVKSGLEYCILRSVFVYGHTKFYKNDIVSNFYTSLSKNIKITAVNDQYISFTFIDDLIRIINLLIKKEASGIYHYSGSKQYTPYELAEILQNYFQLNKSIIVPVPLNQYFGINGKLRLKYATLDCTRIKSHYNLPFSNLEDNLTLIGKKFTERI